MACVRKAGPSTSAIALQLQSAQCSQLQRCTGIPASACPQEVEITPWLGVQSYLIPAGPAEPAGPLSDLNTLTALLAAIESGNVTVNQTELTACAQALANQPCWPDLGDRSLDACLQAFTGSVPAGGHCNTSAECEGFAPCNGQGCSATCASKPSGGCNSNLDCSSNEICVDQACYQFQTPGTAGQPCVASGCQPGLLCTYPCGSTDVSMMTCQPGGSLGTSCVAPDNTCYDFIGPQVISPGGPTLTPCSGGLACVESSADVWLCETSDATEELNLGNGCGSGGVCAPQTQCDPNSQNCGPLPLTGDCSLTAPYCGPSTFCNTNANPAQCQPLPQVGSSCSADIDCLPSGGTTVKTPLQCNASGQCVSALQACSP